VPVFFITSGIRLDLTGLLYNPSALVRVPVFLLALLVVRGLPALPGLRANGIRPTLALWLLRATALTITNPPRAPRPEGAPARRTLPLRPRRAAADHQRRTQPNGCRRMTRLPGDAVPP